jgi:hypothetical protein
MAQSRILDRVRRIAWRMAAALLLANGGLVGSCYGTIVDLEDLSLAPNSYWNGSDGSGGFSSRSAFFNNTYTPAYGSWSGFSYSDVNYTDTSYELDPIANPFYQFAAVTGTGVGGSGNYAVGYGCSSCIALFGGVLPQMTIPADMQVQAAMFTNTTYAAASMRNGDPSAKKFGPDDWLKLTITGQGAPDHVLGSVQFFLAENGSIVSNWRSVNLSSLAGARTLTFDLTSSDNGEFGMNTPAFFAMDSLVLSPLLPGDFNVDGYVNALDLDIWRTNAGLSGPGITWRSGDANSDGVVDGLDKDIWFTHAFRSLDDNLAPGSAGAIDAVPEPSTLVLALAGGLAALVCRWRRRTKWLG